MRLRFRYSLRTSLAAIAIAASGLGLWSYRSVEQQKRIRILQGVHLQFAYDLDGGADQAYLYEARSRLARWLGIDWVAVPVEVNNRLGAIYPEDLAILAQLRSVRRVNLSGTSTDNEGLRALARLPRLEVLELSDTLVTEQGLGHLDNCRSLGQLVLGASLVPRTAADGFGRRHPACRVTITSSRNPSSVEEQRFLCLRADRVPTAVEKVQLDAALRILEEPDNDVKHELSKLIVDQPEGETDPDPNDPYFQRWLQRQPPDFCHDLAIDKLRDLGLAGAIPALERIARNESLDDPLRYGAVESLSSIADRRIVPILIDLLEDPRLAREAWDRLTGVTDEYLGQGGDLGPSPESQIRQNIVKDWRRFWKENGDVLRPRRAGGFGTH